MENKLFLNLSTRHVKITVLNNEFVFLCVFFLVSINLKGLSTFFVFKALADFPLPSFYTIIGNLSTFIFFSLLFLTEIWESIDSWDDALFL